MDFTKNSVILPRLASRLDVLRSSLLFLEREWNESFDRSWTKIEIANAVSLDRGQISVVPEHEEALIEGINELIVLLTSSFSIVSEDEWDE